MLSGESVLLPFLIPFLHRPLSALDSSLFSHCTFCLCHLQSLFSTIRAQGMGGNPTGGPSHSWLWVTSNITDTAVALMTLQHSWFGCWFSLSIPWLLLLGFLCLISQLLLQTLSWAMGTFWDTLSVPLYWGKFESYLSLSLWMEPPRGFNWEPRLFTRSLPATGSSTLIMCHRLYLAL